MSTAPRRSKIDIMAEISAEIQLRPTRIGFLVRPTDLASVRAAMRVCAQGGKVDKKISCLGLLLGAALTFAAVSIPTYQIVLWLLRGTWHAVALENTPASLIRCLGRSWIGLQIVYGWVLAIPATLGLALLAFVVFWSFGIWSAKLYGRQSTAKGLITTPSQTSP